MALAPAVSNDATHVAVPPATIWAAHPAIGTPPSRKATVPVREPEPGTVAFTVAVKVTGCPVTDGFTEDASDVEVAPGLTVCVKTGDVEGVNESVGAQLRR